MHMRQFRPQRLPDVLKVPCHHSVVLLRAQLNQEARGKRRRCIPSPDGTSKVIVKDTTKSAEKATFTTPPLVVDSVAVAAAGV